jgi:uncharacterized protein DUF992
MKKSLVCAAAMAAMGCMASSAAAREDSGVKIGTLACHEASGWGYVIGSSRHIRCEFNGADRVEHYDGSISKAGVDLGYQGSGALVWAVFAPSNSMRPGALTGRYGGVTAGAAVGVGVGANALIGGFDRSITLQPLSVEGTTGLSVAAGVGGMNLHYRPRA